MITVYEGQKKTRAGSGFVSPIERTCQHLTDQSFPDDGHLVETEKNPREVANEEHEHDHHEDGRKSEKSVTYEH